MSSQVPFPPVVAHSTAPKAVRESFFLHNKEDFSSSSVFCFLLLRSPSIIAVHRVRRFFPSHPIAVERNVSAHNTQRKPTKPSQLMFELFSIHPLQPALIHHHIDLVVATRKEREDARKKHIILRHARACVCEFFFPLNIFTQCVRIFQSNSVQQLSKNSAD